MALCAAWCDTCAEFRSALASRRPGRKCSSSGSTIEDDADLCGDIDVENFPTLAIYRGASLLHYGVSLPQEGAVARLVDEVAARAEPMKDAPEPVRALPRALR